MGTVGQYFSLQFAHEGVGIGRSQSGAHGCAKFLEVVTQWNSNTLSLSTTSSSCFSVSPGGCCGFSISCLSQASFIAGLYSLFVGFVSVE